MRRKLLIAVLALGTLGGYSFAVHRYVQGDRCCHGTCQKAPVPAP